MSIFRLAQLCLEGPAGTELNAEVENAIMYIPRSTAGKNTIHFKVVDAANVKGSIEVVYRYQTRSGEVQHRQVIHPADFAENVATYSLNAPGLIRCNSVLVRY
jgi:hypothetical protein